MRVKVSTDVKSAFANALNAAEQAISYTNSRQMLGIVRVIHRAIEDLPRTSNEAVELLRSELSDRLVNASDILWWLERCESTRQLKELSVSYYEGNLSDGGNNHQH